MADEGGGIMRNLGRFVGGIWHGIKTDPAKEGRTEVRRQVEEYPGEHEGRRVIVRRTTIEEVEVPDKDRTE